MAALVHDEPWVDWMQSWSPAGWLGMANRAPAASADLVRRRQRDLLEHAHARSQFYRRHHGRHPGALMPAWQDLPPVDKTTLMANFDQWVTDPAITRAGVEDFLADRSRIGEDFLRRYAIWTSSGTSGEPGIFVQDSGALAVYSSLLESRMDRRFATQRWWPMAASGAFGPWGLQPRSALVAALDGHYASVSFWRRQCRFNPVSGSASRAFSVDSS